METINMDYTKLDKKEFKKKFYKRFDHLMPNRKDMMKSLMLFGICCDRGWHNIIWNLTDCIDNYRKNNPTHIPNFEIEQIKEKFGTLRYYCNEDELVQGMVWFAEYLSSITCERCGKEGNLDRSQSWVLTLCEKCKKKRANKLKKEMKKWKDRKVKQ
jgi:hypothetical protein